MKKHGPWCKSASYRAARPDRTWGGSCVGAICTVCNLPITKDELEFEIQFVRDGTTQDSTSATSISACFAAWEFERRHGAMGEQPACRKCAPG